MLALISGSHGIYNQVHQPFRLIMEMPLRKAKLSSNKVGRQGAKDAKQAKGINALSHQFHKYIEILGSHI